MSKRFIISKRKVILAYILVIIFAFCVGFSRDYSILGLIGTIGFALYLYVNIKYIKCSNCESVIWLRDLYSHNNCCKYCGVRIEIE